MHRHFDDELQLLKEKLLRMSSLAEDAITLSVKALIDRNPDMADKVAKSDDAINMLEIEIDDLALRLLALHQPQASDLRFITSAIKINSDLERIGDLAVNIAQVVKYLIKAPALKATGHISKMAMAAQEMLKDSLNAFVTNDAELAEDVCKRDDTVDKLNRDIFMELLTGMSKDQKTIEQSVDLILVARHLERIADHSTNICEDVIYIIEGKNIKHHIEEKQNPGNQ